MCAVTMVTGYTVQELEMILEKTGSSMLLNRDLIMIVRSEFPSWNPKARHVDFYYQLVYISSTKWDNSIEYLINYS